MAPSLHALAQTRKGSSGKAAAAIGMAEKVAAVLPVELAVALGLKDGGDAERNGDSGVAGRTDKPSDGKSEESVTALKTHSKVSERVELVRLARASVEFRVARRNYHVDLERAAHADAKAIAGGNVLASVSTAAVIARRPGVVGGAAGKKWSTVDKSRGGYNAVVNLGGAPAAVSETKEGSPHAPRDVDNADIRKKYAGDSTAGTPCDSDSPFKVPHGLRTLVGGRGATLGDLLQARLTATPRVPKVGPAEVMVRVLRENQARAVAARAELDSLLLFDALPPPLRGARTLCVHASTHGKDNSAIGCEGDGGPGSARSGGSATVEAAVSGAAFIESFDAASTLASCDAVSHSSPSLRSSRTIDVHAARLRELRPLMTRAIRRRRLLLRRHWEELGAEYAWHHNVWQGELARWEEKMEEEEAMEDGGAVGVTGNDAGGDATGAGNGIGGGGLGAGGRGERRGGRRLSDVVRTDYEEAEVVKKFEDKHKEEERIRKGAVDVPSMLTTVERRQLPEYIDEVNSRGTTDGLPARCAGLDPSVPCEAGCNCVAAAETERKRSNLWTDVEKCIFLDKFLQHPKNFMRISSFLPRKSPEDVVQFYYDSKTSIDYKALLKEAVNRSKVDVVLVMHFCTSLQVHRCMGSLHSCLALRLPET